MLENGRIALFALGGVPRYVLEDVSTTPNDLLGSGCTQCDLDDAIHLVSMDTRCQRKKQHPLMLGYPVLVPFK